MGRPFNWKFDLLFHLERGIPIAMLIGSEK